ncbi:hypothetical protein [Thiocapsa bogorovii]|uniref:hypothetical protein n=1 Tax=Thiocapsa bogorovii TaxID=521689 RepID=UPI001E536D32|nr:hypothetical protein [Thiocapsa bogorovii]UHD17254.1 hypothetical protein LT988_04140 [Thiocapsa bogorovii]
MNDLRYRHIGAARGVIVNTPLHGMEKLVSKYPLRGALFKLNESGSAARACGAGARGS